MSLDLPECALSELLYADDVVLMNETIEGLRNEFITWKGFFESMGSKVNLGITRLLSNEALQRMTCLILMLTYVAYPA